MNANPQLDGNISLSSPFIAPTTLNAAPKCVMIFSSLNLK